MAKAEQPKIRIWEMSEKGIFPGPVPKQLIFLLELLVYYFNPIKNLEVGRISEEQAKQAQNNHYATYSRVRATFYREAASYAPDEHARNRFLRKARASEENAERYS